MFPQGKFDGLQEDARGQAGLRPPRTSDSDKHRQQEGSIDGSRLEIQALGQAGRWFPMEKV